MLPARTTVVGSWWKHSDDETELDRIQQGELTGPDAEAVLDRAATRAVAERRGLGLEGVDAQLDNLIGTVNREIRQIAGAGCQNVALDSPSIAILQRLDGVIDVASLECSYMSQFFHRDTVAALPKSMEFAAGLLDEASYWVEPVKKLRGRAAEWARLVGEERLWLSPSCEFGRHPARDVPVLRQNMQHLVEAAASL